MKTSLATRWLLAGACVVFSCRGVVRGADGSPSAGDQVAADGSTWMAPLNQPEANEPADEPHWSNEIPNPSYEEPRWSNEEPPSPGSTSSNFKAAGAPGLGNRALARPAARPQFDNRRTIAARNLQAPEVGPLTPLTPPGGMSGEELPPPHFDDGEALPPFTNPPFNQPRIRPEPEKLPFVVPYQTRLVGTVLAGDARDLGMTDFDLSTVFAFPRNEGFAITPGFQAFFLNGPRGRRDLPEQLYDARVEFALKQPWNDEFSYVLTFAPGIYSDFENTGSDAFRITSRALGFYKISPVTELTLGIVYVDRDNLSLLPAIGVIHTPNPDVRLELVFPKPKVAARISQAPGEEWWAYLTGEFGGGSFAIQRRSGADDVATYSDWRFLAGVEGKFPGSKTIFQNIPSVFVEGGIVFNRAVEYRSHFRDFDPASTALLRWRGVLI